MNHVICSIEWCREKDLPLLDDIDFDHLREYRKEIDGVVKYPFITVYNPDGTSYKIFLGA